MHPGGNSPPVNPKRTVLPKHPSAKRAPVRKAPPAKPEKDEVSFESETGGRIEDAGPGKNVLRRSKYVREDAGTHDQLKIIDEDALTANDDEDGMDPYNTGQFDRSKTWNNRTRK